MDLDDINKQLLEIGAALGLTVIHDYTVFRPDAAEGPPFPLYSRNPNQPMTRELAAVYVHAAISNVAHFKDPLKEWMKKMGENDQRVEEVVNASPALQIVVDLSNAHNHGSPVAKYPRSGKDPRLGEVRATLQVTSPTRISFGPQGMVSSSGPGGSAKHILVVEVQDKAGNRLGDLTQILSDAKASWEKFIATVKAEKGLA